MEGEIKERGGKICKIWRERPRERETERGYGCAFSASSLLSSISFFSAHSFISSAISPLFSPLPSLLLPSLVFPPLSPLFSPFSPSLSSPLPSLLSPLLSPPSSHLSSLVCSVPVTARLPSPHLQSNCSFTASKMSPLPHPPLAAMTPLPSTSTEIQSFH